MAPVARIAEINPVVDGWTRASIGTGSAWRQSLGPLAAGEAIANLANNGDAPSVVVRESQFPALASLAADARGELANGSGIVWIRAGFSDDLTNDAWTGVFSLFCSLLGMAHRRIDGESDACEHPSMHTVVIDGMVPDVVGSIWLADATPGDDVALVSATGVHDELAQQTPELLRALYREVRHLTHRSDEATDLGSARHVRAPVFRYARSTRSLEFRYDRQRIELAHDLCGRPLPSVVIDAFDALDKSLTLPHLVATLRPRRGDIVLVHNRRVVSSRLVSSASASERTEMRALRVVNDQSSSSSSSPRSLMMTTKPNSSERPSSLSAHTVPE